MICVLKSSRGDDGTKHDFDLCYNGRTGSFTENYLFVRYITVCTANNVNKSILGHFGSSSTCC